MTIKLITDASALKTEIKAIGAAVSKLESRIHVAAVSCLVHAEKHGDVTLMQSLIAALGKSQRRNALLAWCVNYGTFALSEDGKSVVYLKREADAKGAEAEPFWEFMPEPAYVQFDVAGELQKLLTKARKAAKSDKQVTPVTEQALADLERMAQQYAPTAAK